MEFFLIITSGTITAQFKQKEELVINISIVQRIKATGEKVVAPITAIYDNGNGDKGYFNKDNNDNLVATVKESGTVSLSASDSGQYRFLGFYYMGTIPSSFVVRDYIKSSYATIYAYYEKIN